VSEVVVVVGTEAARVRSERSARRERREWSCILRS
jgi:hypothetical protein